MPTYNELVTQAQALMTQAEEVRHQERAQHIANIQAQMREHGLTVDDLRTGKPAGGRAKVNPPKYQGPNGELWSGGPGRKPAWAKAAIAADELEKYRIA